MNVFFREMKAHRKSLIIWCICMVLTTFMGMVKFQSYQGAGQSIGEIFADMPSTLKAVLGFGDYDVTTIKGFFAMLFSYMQLMMVIHAAMLGAGIIAKEERDKTSEFLMVKPVSRSYIITSKLLAALVNVVIFNLVTLVSSIAIVDAYNTGESISGDIVTLMVGMLLSQILFMSIGAGLAAMTKNTKGAASSFQSFT